jgi:protein-disulfide isomerase
MEKGTKYIAGAVVVVLLALTVFAATYSGFGGTGSIVAGDRQNVPVTGNAGNVATGNPDGQDPFFGPENAQVTIIEYSDFQCPFCARAVPVLDQIKSVYGDSVKFVFKDFPLSFHQFAQKAAEAGQCANDQGKFWELHDMMFANQGSIDVGSIKGYASSLGLDTEAFNACLDSGKYAAEVQQDFNEGKAAGVSGTPTFFINGQKIVGAQPFSAFQQIIEQELE